jgi:hypothetical protein
MGTERTRRRIGNRAWKDDGQQIRMTIRARSRAPEQRPARKRKTQHNAAIGR